MLNQLAFFRNLEERMKAVDISTNAFAGHSDLKEEERGNSFELPEPLVRFFGVVRQDRNTFVAYEKGVRKEAKALLKRADSILEAEAEDGDGELSESASEEVLDLQGQLDVLKASVEHAENRHASLCSLFFETLRTEWQSDPEKSELLNTTSAIVLRNNGFAVAEESSSGNLSSALGFLLGGAALISMMAR